MWEVDLPNWHRAEDPEIAGSPIWCHTDYEGTVDVCILVSEEPHPEITVLGHPLIGPAEVDGECLGQFPDWDKALGFALTHLEIKS